MIVAGLSIWIVLLWAVFATVFYRIRYRKVKYFKNPWTMVKIFAVNFFMFAWAIIGFVMIEWIRWYTRKNNIA